MNSLYQFLRIFKIIADNLYLLDSDFTCLRNYPTFFSSSDREKTIRHVIVLSRYHLWIVIDIGSAILHLEFS